MKVLLFIDSLGAGGAQRQLLNIGEYLISRGAEVHLLVYHQESFYEKRAIEMGIILVTNFRGTKFQRMLFCIKQIREYDNIISFLEVPSFLATIAKKKKSVLIVGERNNKNVSNNYFREKILRFLLFRADWIVTNSLMAKKNLLFKYKCLENKVLVIYNALCAPFDFRTEFNTENTNKNTLNCLVVSSFQKHKNQMMVLKAAEELRDYNIRIDFFGGERESNYMNECIEYSRLKNIDNISFCGEVEISPDIYKRYSVLILSSDYEGMPNVVIEALSQGLRVITTPVSDLKELFQRTENVLVDFNDYRALANELKLLINEKKYDYILSNVSLAKRHFSSKENLPFYYQVFNHSLS